MRCQVPSYAAFVHGDDGMGNTAQRKPAGKPIDMTAAEFLVRFYSIKLRHVSHNTYMLQSHLTFSFSTGLRLVCD